MHWPERRTRPRRIAAPAAPLSAVTLVVLAVLAVLAAPGAVLAASPAASQAAIGDPRSSGQGPGLVGDPLSAILVVAAIAGLSLLATLMYVRMTGDGTPGGPRGR